MFCGAVLCGRVRLGVLVRLLKADRTALDHLKNCLLGIQKWMSAYFLQLDITKILITGLACIQHSLLLVHFQSALVTLGLLFDSETLAPGTEQNYETVSVQAFDPMQRETECSLPKELNCNFTLYINKVTLTI